MSKLQKTKSKIRNATESSEVKSLSTVSIQLSDFENLKYLDLENGIEISAVFPNNKMNKGIVLFSEAKADVTMSFEVNCEDQEEVFSLSAYPVLC